MKMKFHFMLNNGQPVCLIPEETDVLDGVMELIVKNLIETDQIYKWGYGTIEVDEETDLVKVYYVDSFGLDFDEHDTRNYWFEVELSTMNVLG